MHLYIGCPIWSFKGWVGNFYPKGTKSADFLREYASRLTAVEGNTTFYAIPPKETIGHWISNMPEGFHFCPKIPRAISHHGKLTKQTRQAVAFIKVMSQFGTRLGPSFLQLPPRFPPRYLDDLKTFLESWPSEYRLAVEVRHLDWFENPHHDSLGELLGNHKMARVVIDTRPIRDLKGDKILESSVYQHLLAARERKPNVPVIPSRTADFMFLRYIGHPMIDHNHSFLDEWTEYLVSELRAGATVYFFCHTPDNLAAPLLCRSLYQRVAKHVPILPLPWDDTDTGTLQQGRLF